MNPKQANQLANVLRRQRQALHLSAHEVARRAGVNVGTITRIELGQILSPRPDNLSAIADVLDIPAADLFAAAGWVSEGELPTLRPYLRSKYQDLSEDAMAEVERFIENIQRKHGGTGPTNSEDET